MSQDGSIISSAPHVAIDASSGAVHVIWGERVHKGERAPEHVRRPSALFYATNKGGQWSRPQRLYRPALLSDSRDDGRVRLSRIVVRSLGLVAGNKDELHLTFSGWDSESEHRSVFYMHRSGKTWAEARVLARGSTPDLVRRGDELFVVFIKAALEYAREAGEPDKNSVFLVKSPDGGDTWSEPVLVHLSGRKAAHKPRIVAGADGRLHALWMKNINPVPWGGGSDFVLETIFHSHSENGEEWSEPVSIADSILRHPRRLEAVADSLGGLHAVFQVGDGLHSPPPYQSYYARWDEGEWSTPEHLFGVDQQEAWDAFGLAAEKQVHLVLNDATNGNAFLYDAWPVSDK